MARIIDLDAVLAPPVQVRLDGKLYKLPADIPVPLYLSVKARQDAEGENADVLDALHSQVLELFQIHQPEMTVLPCGMAQLFQIIPLVYGGEDEKAPDPTRRRASSRGNGRPSSSPARRKKRSAS